MPLKDITSGGASEFVIMMSKSSLSLVDDGKHFAGRWKYIRIGFKWVVIFCQCVEFFFHVKGNSLLLCLDYLSPQRAGLQWEKGFLGRGYEQRRTWTLEIYFPTRCSDLALDFETVSIYLLLQGFPLFRVNYWVEALIHFFRCMECNVILTIINWW